MKLGIIGLPLSGKTTIFDRVHVPDARIDRLSAMYNPKKTIYAQVEYFLPGMLGGEQSKEQSIWNQVRSCDAILHVIRNFEGGGFGAPNPSDDFLKLEQELIFADLVVVEKRLERLDLDKKRHRQIDEKEYELLIKCKDYLEADKPLRHDPEVAQDPLLKGFTFLSGKPMLVLLNNSDDDPDLPTLDGPLADETCIAVRGQLEHEIAQMEGDDAAAFMEEYGIEISAMNRVIRKSYDFLGLMSFFTVGEDEVRAWTIEKNTEAVDAAEAIHSDIKKGFIRAELVAYQDLMDAGSYAEARKKGTVRLEGKTYVVQDGDIINFRFNV